MLLRGVLSALLATVLPAAETPSTEPSDPTERVSLQRAERQYLFGLDEGTEGRIGLFLASRLFLWDLQKEAPRLKRFAAAEALSAKPSAFQGPSAGLWEAVERTAGPSLNELSSGERAELEAARRKNLRYDPALMTLAAGLESRSYSRGQDREWTTIEAAWPESSDRQRYYRQPVSLHYRAGSPDSDRLFVILGSSYSTWKRGTWTNKTVAALDEAFGRPHCIVLPGFLTNEALRAGPRLPALTGRLVATDLLARLSFEISRLKAVGRLPQHVRSGVIGFSGGASLALMIVARDDSPSKTFPLGALAFSPVVDLETTFSVLDEASEAILRDGFSRRKGLTTIDMLGPFLQGYGPGSVGKYLELMSDRTIPRRRESFVKRFYREFLVVDLANTRKAHYEEGAECGDGPLSYRDYYLGCVQRLHREAPRSELSKGSRFGSAEAAYEGLGGGPAYIVFALDDPVLSISSLASQSAPAAAVVESLDWLRGLSGVRVFAPTQGGHMGYFLDSAFVLAAVRGFFGAEAR
ncbi:MAG: hypothetical protein GC160_20320 [Acidobacteria bacterium]|nr:hypothetical protein [Acidobacteriota bacterium]